jgi:hypothetical protein
MLGSVGAKLNGLATRPSPASQANPFIVAKSPVEAFSTSAAEPRIAADPIKTPAQPSHREKTLVCRITMAAAAITMPLNAPDTTYA